MPPALEGESTIGLLGKPQTTTLWWNKILKYFYFILKYSWLTVLCSRCTAKWFTYTYTCVYLFFFSNSYLFFKFFSPVLCVLSWVWLFVSPWTIALQAPLSMEFSRQEYWSRLPFPTLGGSSRLRDQTHVPCISCIGKWILCHCTTWEAPCCKLSFIKL